MTTPKIEINVLPNGVVEIQNPYVNIPIEVYGAVVPKKVPVNPLELASVDVFYTLGDILSLFDYSLEGAPIKFYEEYVNALSYPIAERIMQRLSDIHFVEIEDYEWDDLDVAFSELLAEHSRIDEFNVIAQKNTKDEAND
jgi:hypothetical protein